jgi:O-antigen/teichoic acid export membrane protein
MKIACNEVIRARIERFRDLNRVTRVRVRSEVPLYPILLAVRGLLAILTPWLILNAIGSASLDGSHAAAIILSSILVLVDSLEQPIAIVGMQRMAAERSAKPSVGLICMLPFGVASFTILLLASKSAEPSEAIITSTAVAFIVMGRLALADWLAVTLSRRTSSRGVAGSVALRLASVSLLYATSSLGVAAALLCAASPWIVVLYLLLWRDRARLRTLTKSAIKSELRPFKPIAYSTVFAGIPAVYISTKIADLDDRSISTYTAVGVALSVIIGLQGLLFTAGLPSLVRSFEQSDWSLRLRSLLTVNAIWWSVSPWLALAVYSLIADPDAMDRLILVGLVFASACRQATAPFSLYLIASRQQDALSRIPVLDVLVQLALSAILIELYGLNGFFIAYTLAAFTHPPMYFILVRRRAHWGMLGVAQVLRTNSLYPPILISPILVATQVLSNRINYVGQIVVAVGALLVILASAARRGDLNVLLRTVRSVLNG